MIINAHQELLARWLCERIELMPTANLRCLANINAEGKILGVVGYDNWTGTSAQVHLAGDGIWLTRDFLYHAFNYAFGRKEANLKLLIAVISSKNERSLRFTKHMGFKEITRIEGAHPDGALVVLELRRENCRFLGKEDGQISTRCA